MNNIKLTLSAAPTLPRFWLKHETIFSGVLMVFIGTMIVVLPHFTTGVYDPTVSETDDYICGNRTGVNPYCERSQPGYAKISITFVDMAQISELVHLIELIAGSLESAYWH